jgi:flavin-dependent dehydrogenase
MLNTHVIIVGGGPAGAACARILSQSRIDFIILDRAAFPRYKPCAGWLTPRVWRDLQMEPREYPHDLTLFNRFQVWIKDLHFQLHTHQYAVRRIEFDDWLIHPVAQHLIQHTVKQIELVNGEYVVDHEFAAPFIVGAGGTHCPVKQKFFDAQPQGTLIVAQEEEFLYDYNDDRCHLWFFQNGLPGYSWYFPKANGILNMGVGGSTSGLKNHNDTLKRHWRLLEEKLDRMGLVRGREFKPAGHSYFLRSSAPALRSGGALLIGDALGMATLDMGEGITPSIESGIRAARAILENKTYSINDIPRYSFPSLLRLRK